MNTLRKKSPVPSKKRVACFNVIEDRCIWMKAGVINFRICDNAFDCNTCAFDKALRKAMRIDPHVDTPTAAPQWVAHLIERYDGANRPCRHALTGRIAAPKICPYNYACHHCPFDQMLDEVDLAADWGRPVCRTVSGFALAADHYYHMGHSWARFEHGGRVRVGLDDFAARLFGHLNTIDLPPLGAEVLQDRVGWTFGRENHRAAVLSPVTGTVLAVNHPVREHPQLVNEDPYGGGWLFILEPDIPKRNLKRLFFGQESVQWLDQESQKLHDLLGPPYQLLAATGASAVRDIYGSVETLRWELLTAMFLHTSCKP
ncbi:glycine cleavage system protein H [Desulfosarcina sp.]|uniref:glycine cleavage system protein H n=1 Tax=Desulfosarcina sp. TaxID=2027861 RepID=UPI003970A776